MAVVVAEYRAARGFNLSVRLRPRHAHSPIGNCEPTLRGPTSPVLVLSVCPEYLFPIFLRRNFQNPDVGEKRREFLAREPVILRPRRYTGDQADE